jgi:hypothetical protein
MRFYIVLLALLLLPLPVVADGWQGAYLVRPGDSKDSFLQYEWLPAIEVLPLPPHNQPGDRAFLAGYRIPLAKKSPWYVGVELGYGQSEMSVNQQVMSYPALAYTSSDYVSVGSELAYASSAQSLFYARGGLAWTEGRVVAGDWYGADSSEPKYVGGAYMAVGLVRRFPEQNASLSIELLSVQFAHHDMRAGFTSVALLYTVHW